MANAVACEQYAGDEKLVLRRQKMQHATRRRQCAAAVLKPEYPSYLGCRLAYIPVVTWHVEYSNHHYQIGDDDRYCDAK